MSDSDKKLELEIEFNVELSAAIKAREELVEMKRQATAMGVSTAELDKEISQVDKSISEMSKKSSEATGNARDMHKAFHALNEIVPGLGSALKLAFHPTSIGIVGLLTAFEGLKSVLESIKTIDSIKPVDFVGSAEAVEAVRQSYEKAQIAARLFIDEQNRLNQAGASAEDVSKRQIENYKNLAAAQEEFNTAQKNLAESRIDFNEKNGVIEHGVALRQKYLLDVEYAKKKLMLEAQTNEAVVSAKKKQLETEAAQLLAAQSEQKTDEANAAQADAARAKHEQNKATAQKNKAAAETTLDELAKPKGKLVKGEISDENVGNLEGFFNDIIPADQRKGDETHSEMFLKLQEFLNKNNAMHGKWSTPEMRDARVFMAHDLGNQSVDALAKYDGAKKQLENAEKELRNLEATQFKVELNAERGKKQLDATDENIRKLSASVNALVVQIPQIKADNAAKLNNDAATKNLELRAEAAKSGLPDPGNTFIATPAPVASAASETMDNQTPWRYDFNKPTAPAAKSPKDQARSDFNQADHARDFLQHGGRMAENQAQQLQRIVSVMSGHAVSSDKILETLNQIMSSQKTRDEAFQRELDNLKYQNAVRR